MSVDGVKPRREGEDGFEATDEDLTTVSGKTPLLLPRRGEGVGTGVSDTEVGVRQRGSNTGISA